MHPVLFADWVIEEYSDLALHETGTLSDLSLAPGIHYYRALTTK